MSFRRISFVVLALLVFVPFTGGAEETCPAPEASLEELLGAPTGTAAEETLDFEALAPLPLANFCTKEVCSVNRLACRNDCAPCGFAFTCNFPVCNSCNCLC